MAGARKKNRGKLRRTGTAAQTRKVVGSNPPSMQVGLPKVPEMYGLKPREKYLPWKHATERLERSRNYWICSTRPDGRPHSIPVWGHWMQDTLYFGTVRASRKGQNLAQNPAVSIHLESGDDVVILEGRVFEVNDQPSLTKMDRVYRKKYKMPLLVIPGETVVYGLRPRVVLAWSEKEYLQDATRWEFTDR